MAVPAAVEAGTADATAASGKTATAFDLASRAARARGVPGAAVAGGGRGGGSSAAVPISRVPKLSLGAGRRAPSEGGGSPVVSRHQKPPAVAGEDPLSGRAVPAVGRPLCVVEAVARGDTSAQGPRAPQARDVPLAVDPWAVLPFRWRKVEARSRRGLGDVLGGRPMPLQGEEVSPGIGAGVVVTASWGRP